ncbi:MAG: DinB family protein [Pseudomonadota bacterium]
MISPDHCALLGRYNRWQNQSLLNAAATLSSDALHQDRGAFFGSILGTFNHLLWGDQIWMSRFAGWDKPEGGIAQSSTLFADLAAFRPEREDTDARLAQWTAARTPGDLDGMLSWYSGATGRHIERPVWVCLTHLFNHQTHHRGQIHAMLTAAGAKPDDTDLVFMPDAA